MQGIVRVKMMRRFREFENAIGANCFLAFHQCIAACYAGTWKKSETKSRSMEATTELFIWNIFAVTVF